MIIIVDDGQLIPSPQAINWEPPAILAKDGQGALIDAPYWTCTLSVPITTTVLHLNWFELRDSALHTFILPHPATGVMTAYSCYVDSVNGTFDTRGDCAAMVGVDMVLSRITVE